MSILGKLFGSKPSNTDVRALLHKLDAQHRELGIATFTLVQMRAFGPSELLSYAKAVAQLLQIQATPAGSKPLVLNGKANYGAIGYIYGAADAALQIIGQNMSDESVGVPFACEVYDVFSPEHMEACMKVIFESAGKDNALMQGMTTGGQQFLEYAKSGGNGRMPVGLINLLLG